MYKLIYSEVFDIEIFWNGAKVSKERINKYNDWKKTQFLLENDFMQCQLKMQFFLLYNTRKFRKFWEIAQTWILHKSNFSRILYFNHWGHKSL
jgi:hypothetical protein